MDQLKLTFDEFISCIHDYKPNIIFNNTDTNILSFMCGDMVHGISIDCKIDDTYNGLNDPVYLIDDFFKNVNIIQRREKILKLKEKWQSYR